MKKKILIISILVVILIQIFLLASFFVNRHIIVSKGDEYKILIEKPDLTCVSKNGYIKFNLMKKVGGKGEYAILKVLDNGYTELSEVMPEVPEQEKYIRNNENGYFSFPFEKYYIDHSIENDDSVKIPSDYNAYITIAVKDGKAELINLLIDGEHVEKYIK